MATQIFRRNAAAGGVNPATPVGGGTDPDFYVHTDNGETKVRIAIFAFLSILAVLIFASFNGWFASAKQEARKDLEATTTAYVAVNAPSLTESLAAVGALKNNQPIVVNRPAPPSLVLGSGVPKVVPNAPVNLGRGPCTAGYHLVEAPKDRSASGYLCVPDQPVK